MTVIERVNEEILIKIEIKLKNLTEANTIKWIAVQGDWVYNDHESHISFALIEDALRIWLKKEDKIYIKKCANLLQDAIWAQAGKLDEGQKKLEEWLAK